MAFKMKGFSPFHQEIEKVLPGKEEVTTPIPPKKQRLVQRTTKRKLPTYKEAWANMSEEEKAKHGSYEAFKAAAIEYNKPKKTKLASPKGMREKLSKFVQSQRYGGGESSE